MGFWYRDVSASDIELIRGRIEDIEDSLAELRSIRPRYRNDKHKLFKINYDIGELNNKLKNLREERDSFYEKNYSHEPEAYTKNLGKPITAKKILVLALACCLLWVAIILAPYF